MDAHRETYNDWNTKNETLLQRIVQLENDIERAQHSIALKQKEINQIHQDDCTRIKQQQQMDAYETIFNSNILYDIDAQSTSTNSLSQGPVATHTQQRKRRDITEQILTSTARVCHKVERVWSDHPVQFNQAPGLSKIIDDNSNNVSLSMEHDIKQLLETQSSKSYLGSLALLLQHDIDHYKELLASYGLPNTKEQNDDKENDTSASTKDTDWVTEKLDRIEQQQKERLQRVTELEQGALDLGLQMQTLETQLERQIERQFSDPEVQKAFSTSVMANVEKTQESNKLASYETYLGELKQIASILEGKHASMDKIQKETVDAINSVAVQRRNIKKIKTINQHESDFCAQKEQATSLMESIRTLQRQLNADAQDQQVLSEPKLGGKKSLESMDRIKQSLGCLPSTAPDKVIENIVSLLERVLLSTSYQQTSVQNELETLTLSWTEELKDKGIDPPQEKPEQDTIDTVVESVHIVQEHVEKDWNDFMMQQQALLSSKVETIEENRKYLENIRLLLGERKHIRKGQVGNDYTAQDRNLQEWFQLLDEM